MPYQPLLNYFNQYVEFDAQEIDLLTSKLKYRKYLKGQYMVQQGDVCRYNSFVVKGCTKTFYLDEDGQEHIIMFSVENWWSTDLGSFISQSPAAYNIQCIENTEVIQLTYEDEEDITLAIPKVDRAFRKVLEKALVASQERLVRNFSITALQRYQYFREQYPQLEQRIPLYMIASYLGITKEFLSKIRNQK
ncbi:Crp/Fnr family transcriptional regulator [Membranihabitans marinus]|uniref:Crp/Fnr family transcriptional regulator n=1 Tax=Membranihabitans marinus TaxID=1227546 RepID=UPI001F44496A|nr:Crp/Fnr family transcriptional regulator [Membranihabitans marinus]